MWGQRRLVRVTTLRRRRVADDEHPHRTLGG